MEKIFKAAVERGASDLHIKSGDFFRARIHGDLVALTNQKLTADQVKQIALHLMTNEDDKKRIDKIMDYDCSWALRSEEHTSELQSRLHLVCRLLLEKKKKKNKQRS